MLKNTTTLTVELGLQFSKSFYNKALLIIELLLAIFCMLSAIGIIKSKSIIVTLTAIIFAGIFVSLLITIPIIWSKNVKKNLQASLDANIFGNTVSFTFDENEYTSSSIKDGQSSSKSQYSYGVIPKVVEHKDNLYIYK